MGTVVGACVENLHFLHFCTASRISVRPVFYCLKACRHESLHVFRGDGTGGRGQDYERDAPP